jgi:hypothetical protein
VAELAPVDGKRRTGQRRKAGEQDEWRKPSHPILRCVFIPAGRPPAIRKFYDNSSGGGARMHAQIMSDVAAAS